MKLKIIEDRLRREHNLPSDFTFFRFSSFPKTQAPIYVEFVGAQCPTVTRGKRKGRPNYRKATGERTFIVTVEQGEQWEADYERETGNCRNCTGDGRTVCRIDFRSGETDYRPCGLCGGSGNAKTVKASTP